jgi:hypothetical protein
MGIVRYYTSKLAVKRKIVSISYEIKALSWAGGVERRLVIGRASRMNRREGLWDYGSIGKAVDDWLIKSKESPRAGLRILRREI